MKPFFYLAMTIAFAAMVAGAGFQVSATEAEVPLLYKTKCAGCHGTDGRGDTAMGKKIGAPDLHSPEIAKMKDSDLIEIVWNGKNKMPAYNQRLTKAQTEELVKYIRSLKQ